MKIKKYNIFLESIKKDIYDIIPQSVKDINIIFKRNDRKLYLVGGAVRDFLNNEDPKDFDLCTDATPDEILNILKDYRTNQQGKSFGVIVVYTKDQVEGMEIATFREDIYGDKLGVTRNPDVKFSTIDKDVLRRDIPFNAMFYDLDKKEIVDLVGGQDDIKNKITRFVGNPDDRIEEDPLRILRLLRFSCRYDFAIDNITKESILKNKDKLSIITRERVYDELKKSWKQSKDFNNYLNYITEFDMWDQVFPGANINTKLVDSDSFLITITNLFANENTNRLETRLVQSYKIQSEIAVKIVFLLNMSNLTEDNVFDFYKKKVQSFVTNEMIIEWMRVKNIKSNIYTAFTKYKPVVSADELMQQGFKPGRELGLEIKRLETENFRKLL